jgi:hypothetical protein
MASYTWKLQPRVTARLNSVLHAVPGCNSRVLDAFVNIAKSYDLIRAKVTVRPLRGLHLRLTSHMLTTARLKAGYNQVTTILQPGYSL